MKTTITARKVNLTDSFKDRVESKLAKLDKFFDDDSQAQVTVSSGKKDVKVEITVKNKGYVYRVERTAKDKNDALESSVDSLVKQIVKNKSKLANRFKSGAFEESAIYGVEAEDEFDLIKTKTFSVKPMNVDEAILQMNMTGHAFFIFMNEDDDGVNVVYRRNDGGYGLLVPQK